MAVLKSLRSLGIDVDDQLSVVRTIRSLALTDLQKTNMLIQYLDEAGKTLSAEANTEAIFLTDRTT